MQVKKLHPAFDRLQKRFGGSSLKPVYGAGCVKNPKAMLVFMNPTGKNVSAHAGWDGLRAPWLGTKSIWPMFHELGYISEKSFGKTQTLKYNEWSAAFAKEIYKELQRSGIYVTNLAKCTQADARHLKDSTFKNYVDLLFREISLICPQKVIAFGNQVSSIILNKPVSVNRYKGIQKEVLKIRNKSFNVYPVYYPVGQGRRNMPLAMRRVRKVVK